MNSASTPKTVSALTAAFTLTTLLAPIDASGAAISVNIYNDRNTAGELGATEDAGVVAYSNWNNVGPFSQKATPPAITNTTDLSDNTGATTTADFTFTTSGANFQQTTTDPTDADRSMMNHWANLSQINITDLPDSYSASGYDVYIYFDWHNDNTNVSATIGATTYYGRDTTSDYTLDPSPTYVRATSTDSTSPTVGNYFKFEGLTGTSFSAALSGSVIPITGFQVVQVPEPASLALVTVGILCVAVRGRRG